MIYILSWTTKKHQIVLSRPPHSKLKKIQGLFKDLHRNLRTFQGKMEFKDFSRTSLKIQGPFKTVWALLTPRQRIGKALWALPLLMTDQFGQSNYFWRLIWRILHGRAGIQNFSSSVEKYFTSACISKQPCNVLFII